MVFSASGVEALVLDLWQSMQERKRLPFLATILGVCISVENTTVFFPGTTKTISRNAWGPSGAFLIQALSAGCDAALVELPELWKQFYDCRGSYESSAAPVGASVSPGEFSSTDVEGGQEAPFSEAEMGSEP